MAGIIAVYGLVVAVLIAGDLAPPPQKTYSLFSGAMHLAAGLSVGLAGLSAGYTIGLVGDMGVRSYMQQSRVFVGMVLILIFGEVLGLYGYGSPRRPTPSSHTGSPLRFKRDGMDAN
ncbi:V-type proton ATPase proteolipid subunit 2 [Paracoccidioides brasiliensis]|nr:V-type proton ATPase proteolipid subunit 2 [Paracoccidioides brasiliensis]